VDLPVSDGLRLPEGATLLRRSMRIDFIVVPRWYERLWAWFKRRVLRIQPPPPPLPMRITKIDYETRTVTIE
jgi:hypothetical protein